MQSHFLKYYFLCFFFASANLIIAQVNLVTNPSFEDIDSCYGDPSSLGFDVFQWTGCKGWSTPTFGSSDLFCENPVFGALNPPLISSFGYQYPKSGDNMAGLFITEGIQGVSSNYREYIQNKLLATLEANKYYEINFYVNSSDTFNYSSDIGVYFSNTAVTNSISFYKLPYTPQIKNPINNFITDTIGWQKISGVYKAFGGEQYITIGCFSDSASIALTDHDTLTAGGVYLFVDDFSLEELPIVLEIPNVFSPNGDGINDLFVPKVKNLSNWKCSIYNRWGEKVFEINEKTMAWEGANASDGVYYYVFEGQNEQKEYKENGFLQLLR